MRVARSLKAWEVDMALYAEYTGRRDAIIAEAYRHCGDAPYIAEVMGMGRATVYRVLRAAGIPIGDDPA